MSDYQYGATFILNALRIESLLRVDFAEMLHSAFSAGSARVIIRLGGGCLRADVADRAEMCSVLRSQRDLRERHFPRAQRMGLAAREITACTLLIQSFLSITFHGSRIDPGVPDVSGVPGPSIRDQIRD